MRYSHNKETPLTGNPPYDLNDESSKRELDTFVDQAINEDELVHSKYWPEWNEVDDRLNGTRVPSGWVTKYSDVLATKNDPTIAQNEKDQIKEYVTVPRTRPNHESVVGDFATQRRRMVITGDNPTDRNIAKVIQKTYATLERMNMLNAKIFFPMIDKGFAKGVHWVKPMWKPMAKGLKKRFRPIEISARDVLVDHQSKGAFFASARRITHRSKIAIDDADEMFRHLPHYQPVSADTRYDEAWSQNTDPIQDNAFATFYEFQFKRSVAHYYEIDTQTGDPKEISTDEFLKKSQDPAVQPYLIAGDVDDEYYTALFNHTIGVFHLERNPYDMFTMIPLVNMETESRLYPLGDIVVYANLADLLDVVVTVFLDNAKRTNIPIADVDELMWDEYGEHIQNALKHGGAAPGIKNIFNTQPINSHLVNLIPFIISWIQDSTSKHSASMGELPAQQIAKETVQLLVSKDRQAHGRKDITLGYVLTMFARLTVKMIVRFMDEADFIPVMDTLPGKPGHIPINQVWKPSEYEAQLASLYTIQVPQQPKLDAIQEGERDIAVQAFQQQMLAYQNAIQQARLDFESDNDAKEQQVSGWIIQGQEFLDEDILFMEEKMKMDDRKFIQTYNPKKAMVTVFVVNDIKKEDVEYNILYHLDTDYQNDPQYKSNLSFALQERGALSRLDLLRETGVPEAEEKYKRAMKESEAVALAMEIAKNPELLQYIKEIVATAGNGKAKQTA